MRRVVGLASGALLTFGLLVPVLAAPAVAVPLPRQVTTSTQTLVVDVDGDGVTDTVNVEKTVYASRVALEIKAVTSKSGTISKSVQSDDFDDLIDSYDAGLYGAAKLDKLKGAELIVNLRDGDAWLFLVLTCRDGKLVFEKSPYRKYEPSEKVWGMDAEYYSGYKFFTKKGKRYVDAAMIGESGRIYRSVWSNGRWKYQKSRKFTDWKHVERWDNGFHGVTLIKP